MHLNNSKLMTSFDKKIFKNSANLNRIGLHFLHFERVNEPKCDVDDEQESNSLPAGFGAVLFRSSDSTSRHVRDENHLDGHLSIKH